MRIGMILDNEINDDIRVQNEINILVHSGHEVILLCKGKHSNHRIERRENLVIYRVFLPKKIYGVFTVLSQIIPFHFLFWYYNFNKIAKKYSLDVIHAHDMYMFKVAKKIAVKFKLSLILDLHENFPATIKSYGWTKKWYARLFYNVSKWEEDEFQILSLSDRVIVLSDDFKKELLSKYPSLNNEKFIRYSNVPDISFFDSLEIKKNILNKGDDFFIFYFGIIAERRGIYTLMEAVEKIAEKHRQVKLLLIGPVDNAEKKKFQKASEKLEQSANLIYYPWKDISLLPSYIDIADVCISPLVKNEQHESGVANKIFQYMYYQKPIIVSDCRPQAHIAIEDNCGLIFDSGNADSLIDQICKFIENPELINDMGIKGKEAVVSKYNVQIEGKNIIDMYVNL